MQIGTKTRYIRLLYAEYIYHCSPYLVLTVSREALVQDALQQIGLKAMNIFKPLRVRFVDGGEEGVDQGGVQKEFFPQFFKLVLSPDHGMPFFVLPKEKLYLKNRSMQDCSNVILNRNCIGLDSSCLTSPKTMKALAR